MPASMPTLLLVDFGMMLLFNLLVAALGSGSTPTVPTLVLLLIPAKMLLLRLTKALDIVMPICDTRRNFFRSFKPGGYTLMVP